MGTETGSLPVNYHEIQPKELLARLRHTLRMSVPLAVAELANHLPAEDQTEYRMPIVPAYIEVVVASAEKDRYFRITYFVQTTQYPEKSTFLTQQLNKIVVEEGKFWTHGQTEPSPTTWKNWQALSGSSRHVWERNEETGPQKVGAKSFEVSRTAIYQGKQLESGDPAMLPFAVATLDQAFQTHGPHIQSLDKIEKIAWGTIVEPEKPEPPSGGGHRVPQAEKKLVPIPISIPL